VSRTAIGIDRKEQEREMKICSLMITECGLETAKIRIACVKENQDMK